MLEAILQYLQSRVNSLSLFDKVHGLVELVQRQTTDGEIEVAPAEYCSKGNYDEIDYDRHQALIYFRQNGAITREEVEDEQQYACEQYLEQTIPMKAVGFVPKDIYNTDNQFIDNKVIENVTNALATTNNKPLQQSIKADSITIAVTEFTTDRQEVIETEYPEGFDIKIDYDRIYFSIDFEIIVTATVGCFDFWACNDTTETIDFGGDAVVMTAAFTADNTTPNAGDVVTFTDSSTQSPTNWCWDFGDGNFSVLQNPTHTYVNPGTYTVTLLAATADGKGDTEVKTSYITVAAAPLTNTKSFGFLSGAEKISWGNIFNDFIAGASKKFTVCFWYKRDAVSGATEFVFQKHDSFTAQRGLQIFIHSGNKWRFSLTNKAATAFATYEGSTTVTDTAGWHLIIFKYDQSQALANRVQMILDDVAETVSVVSSAGSPDFETNTATLDMGTNQGSNSYDGYGDEVAFINKLTTATDDTNTYNMGTPINLLIPFDASELKLWARADGDTLPTVLDASGNANTGTGGGGLTIETDAP